jgi:hypothetical protein
MAFIFQGIKFDNLQICTQTFAGNPQKSGVAFGYPTLYNPVIAF